MPSSAANAPRRTRLRAALDTGQKPKPTPVDAFRIARRRWLAGERLDIGALAAELGVGRATLFRWVGSRELLIAEILWSLFEPTLQHADTTTRTRGARRVAQICERAIRAIVDFGPLRRFIQQDAEYALRLVTSKASPVQARTVAAVRTLLQREAERGALQLPLDVDTLAYLVVRVGESFVYADAISGQRVDVGDAALAIELLLSGTVEKRVKRNEKRVGAS